MLPPPIRIKGSMARNSQAHRPCQNAVPKKLDEARGWLSQTPQKLRHAPDPHVSCSRHRQARIYGAAPRSLALTIEHRLHKELNKPAAYSHQPARRQERIIKRFKSARQVQRFVSIHGQVANLFQFPRHSLSANVYRSTRILAYSTWTDIATARLAA